MLPLIRNWVATWYKIFQTQLICIYMYLDQFIFVCACGCIENQNSYCNYCPWFLHVYNYPEQVKYINILHFCRKHSGQTTDRKLNADNSTNKLNLTKGSSTEELELATKGSNTQDIPDRK